VKRESSFEIRLDSRKVGSLHEIRYTMFMERQRCNMFCWLFKFTISHACDADKPLWSVTQQHLKSCSDCREFYNFCRLLNKELPAEVKVNIPAAMHKRILHNISGIETKTYTTRININISPVAVAAVLTIIILLGGIYFFTGRQAKKITLNQNNLNLAGVTNELAGLVASSIEWTKADGVIENPIKAELQNIVNDANSAATFLMQCVDVDFTGADNIEERK
jgi:hypothetical protein